MIAPNIPANEQERLAALRRYDILDTDPEIDFDAITASIATICGTPMAAVSLIDAHRQWFKSHPGLEVSETSREVSFCAHAILEPDGFMVVPDAAADARFATNPLVTGSPSIAFYAGATLISDDGHALGALCVLDTQPRNLTPAQREALRLAGRMVDMLLEQRQTIAKLRAATHEMLRVESELRAEIDAREVLEERLSFSSSHDDLTRLPNRADFLGRLQAAVDRLHGHEYAPFAVAFIDLDRFKNINDTLGHLAGDALLVEVGRRLTDVIRSGDAVARLGGDEFTMLINGASNELSARAIANRVSEVLASKLRLAGVDISVTASVGIVLVDKSYTTIEEILRDADIAMYAAKETGRNRCTIFTTSLREEFALASEMQSAVRTALDCEQFRLAYQPIVSLHPENDDAVAFEALLRWEQPDGTLISAAQFIETAEKTGLIVEIGDWVLREACAQAHRWQTELGYSAVTAVNVSARQLAEPDFARKVKETVRLSGLDPRLLALEVTESVLITDVDASIAIMDDLRRFGIKIYLDDFGTGYSSLNYLRRFPLDRIKIDRSFVSAVGEELADPVIVNSIISLAHKLNLRVVAEGVETQRQRSALAQFGCDFAQGFLYSKAVSPLEASEFIAAWNKQGGGESAA